MVVKKRDPIMVCVSTGSLSFPICKNGSYDIYLTWLLGSLNEDMLVRGFEWHLQPSKCFPV